MSGQLSLDCILLRYIEIFSYIPRSGINSLDITLNWWILFRVTALFRVTHLVPLHGNCTCTVWYVDTKWSTSVYVVLYLLGSNMVDSIY